MSPIYVNTETGEHSELDRANPRLDAHPLYKRLGERGEDGELVRSGVLTDPKLAVIPQPPAPSRIDRPHDDEPHETGDGQADADADTKEEAAAKAKEEAAAKAKAETPPAQPGQTQRGGRRARQG